MLPHFTGKTRGSRKLVAWPRSPRPCNPLCALRAPYCTPRGSFVEGCLSLPPPLQAGNKNFSSKNSKCRNDCRIFHKLSALRGLWKAGQTQLDLGLLLVEGGSSGLGTVLRSSKSQWPHSGSSMGSTVPTALYLPRPGACSIPSVPVSGQEETDTGALLTPTAGPCLPLEQPHSPALVCCPALAT